MSQSKDKILLVDDDPTLCQLLTRFLSAENFDILMVNNGADAIETIFNEPDIDAIVLDVMMPEVSGLDVLKIVRQELDVPVLMLTGRGDDIDRIIGLELGADDYIGKPCNPRELSARIKAILRRTKYSSQNNKESEVLCVHGITMELGSLVVRIDDQKLDFTGAEFNVLRLLMESAGQALTKEVLTEKVLNRKLTSYDRSIDVHVCRIRQKLSSFGELKHIIKAVRGVGYQMLADT